MNAFKYNLFILITISLFSCKKDEKVNDFIPHFVVEGWIENDDYPRVILTHNLPFFTSLDSAQLANVIIRNAKVTVSDGIETEVLTAGRDDHYFPYFMYKGTSLKGKSGGSYKLKIEYANFVLEAETSIPKTVPLDSIWFLPKTDNNQQLNVRFNDPAAERNYYRLYTKLEKANTFSPVLLSNQNDKYFNGKDLSLQINRGPENNLTSKNEPYFLTGDTVMIKFSAIPESGFEFWSSFQDEILNASNPLMGSTVALKTNIKGPGVGIWCGYGSTIYKRIAK